MNKSEQIIKLTLIFITESILTGSDGITESRLKSLYNYDDFDEVFELIRPNLTNAVAPPSEVVYAMPLNFSVEVGVQRTMRLQRFLKDYSNHRPKK